MSLYAKKKSFMIKKYGYFKTAVKLSIQCKTFSNNMKTVFKNNESAFEVEDRLRNTLRMFEYLHSTLDLWEYKNKFSETVKNKLFEFVDNYACFKTYLYSFGYVCPYPKRNGVLCDRELDTNYEGLCKTHFDCKQRLKKRIGDSIRHLPVDVSNIIFEYAIPR